MNCDIVEEHLSAYIDEELDAAACLQLEEHVEQCDACRGLMSEYRSMGVLMRRSERIVDTEAVWEQVSRKLESPVVTLASTEFQWRDWAKRYGTSILAAAAGVLILVSALRYAAPDNHDTANALHDHAAMAVDFAEVFRSARTEPQIALSKLSEKYDGRELGTEEATKYLGYQPALFKSVPEGFTRVSTHVLNMPCCKCSATICERSDGTSLIVFEHRDEQPVWFGDSPSIETQCAGMPCKIIESAGQLAVSWRNQDRQMTILGADDLTEVNHWVASLKL
jgi:negative regulator of sigma E activity